MIHSYFMNELDFKFSQIAKTLQEGFRYYLSLSKTILFLKTKDIA